MEEFQAPQPSAVEVVRKLAVLAGIEAAILFVMLVVVLHLLRRWTELTFPEPADFYRNVLIIAVAAAVLWMVPYVGWILALVTIGVLTIRFFDGDILDGFYVAVALWGTHQLTALFLVAHLRG